VLICIIKEKNFDRPFLIDHNIDVFKEGLLRILKHNEKMMKKLLIAGMMDIAGMIIGPLEKLTRHKQYMASLILC